MTALCQQRTHAAQQTQQLFNHVVGASEHQWRHVEAQRLGGFEIDDHLKLGWRLDRQSGRRRTFEDAVDVHCRLAELCGEITAIRDQAARVRKNAIEIDRWYAVASRQRNDQFTISRVKYIRYRQEAATRIARLRGDNAFDFIRRVNWSETRLDGKG